MSSDSPVFELSALQGLTAAKSLLPFVWTSGSGVHATLFFGIEGSGKSTLAHILARAWLCHAPSESGACGECSACAASFQDLSADLLVIEPKGSSEWISIHNITERKLADAGDHAFPLQTFLRTMPVQSRHKVVVIESAHRLTPSAANALLKTLEEPPPYGRFILTTRFLSQVLPTIQSRCALVACEVPESESGTHLSIGELKFRSECSGIRSQVRAIAEQVISGPSSQALSLANSLRKVAEDYVKQKDLPARLGQGEILKWFAEELLDLKQPERVADVIETHKRVLGNGSFGLATDALLARICS